MLTQFQQWLANPFNANMSALKWAAFVGLILALLMFWGVVLRNIEAAA